MKDIKDKIIGLTSNRETVSLSRFLDLTYLDLEDFSLEALFIMDEIFTEVLYNLWVEIPEREGEAKKALSGC